MSVLFHDRFADTTLHVLHVRGRTAFLALEIGAAAGHSDGGQGFVDLLTREWAASFDEDEDVAQLVGAELDALKREVPLPPTTTTVIVLFSTGVDRALQRSHARNARALLGFIHGRILSRVISLAAGRDDDDTSGGAPAEAPPPGPLPKRAALLVRTPAIRDAIALAKELQVLVAQLQHLADTNAALSDKQDRIQRQVLGYKALIRLAEELRALKLISVVEYSALHVEAVEILLGGEIETSLPPFRTDASAVA
jgi:hypothetical protein